MDLHTITTVRRPRCPEEVETWADGHAWLAGGTWLFSEPQVHTDTLIDLEGFGWQPLQVTPEGLKIAATCRVVQLDQFQAPPEWSAAPLIPICCRSFLASYKIWNEATVGGNLAMSLPAGPMIALTAALEGTCTLWSRDGAKRHVPVAQFVTGDNQNILQPGELLRSVFLPQAALEKTFAFRRFTLTHQGRSEALLIGTRDPGDGEILLTVTAATLRPYQFRFAAGVTSAQVRGALDAAIADDMYLDDTHGSPRHRKHLTYLFAEQIRAELSGEHS
ncbi:MAG: FAD-binding molybdopterin dehydrogenase [Planctomycetota bacterium]|nr:MAG: FAD-binding molybdopterin dehydrogenase [Planctomycetota bacterium]